MAQSDSPKRISDDSNPEQDRYAARLPSPLYRFFDRIFFLFQLHAAMLAGILAGLVVFGIFPSLFAAAALCQESLDRRGTYVFSRFFRLWKDEFRKANQFGALVYVSLAVSFGIWYVLWYVRQPILATLANLLFFLVMFGLLLLVFYFPALRLYYRKMRVSRLVLFSVLFGFGHFASTLLLFLITSLWVLFGALLPQFAVFLFLSVLPWTAVVLTRRVLPREIVKREEAEL